jgi:hypothetical protein
MSDWKFDTDEVGDDDAPKREISPEDEILEPGSPSAENVFFVLLGIFMTVFIFLRLLGLA